jgi:hypothetical protein
LTSAWRPTARKQPPDHRQLSIVAARSCGPLVRPPGIAGGRSFAHKLPSAKWMAPVWKTPDSASKTLAFRQLTTVFLMEIVTSAQQSAAFYQ